MRTGHWWGTGEAMAGHGPGMRMLLIDNYDSFTYNLFQALGRVCGREPVVLRNDDSAGLRRLDLRRIGAVVVSPGPGTPARHRDFGISRWAVSQQELPVLGICLGFQGLCLVNGAQVVPAATPMHGRLSDIVHDGDPLFDGIPSPFAAVRYHSLVVTGTPDALRLLAWTCDRVPMAARHRTLPQWGVQFHPESIATVHGERLLANFRDLAAVARPGSPTGRRPAAPTGPAADAAPTGPAASAAPTGPAADAAPTGPAAAPAARGAGAGGPSPYLVEVREVSGGVADAERAFAALFGADRYAYWLDTARLVPGLSRFSVLGGAGPLAELVHDDAARARVTVTRPDGSAPHHHAGTLWEHLDRTLRERAVADAGLPCGFNLGYVGWLGYELAAGHGAPGRRRPPARVPRARAAGAPQLPDGALLFSDRALVIDHLAHRAWLLCLRLRTDPVPGWLDRARDTLRDAAPLPEPPEPSPDDPPVPVLARHARARYAEMIAACQREIAAGESYEICLTNMLTVPATVPPWPTYRLLRRANPAPYGAYLRWGDAAVLSSSPERFLRIDVDGTIESRPIKGTRPRGDTPARDRWLAAELAASEKERAENLMIVDLVRNDIGRVARPGSVHVPALFAVESYETVHQLVSTVRGELRPACGPVAAVRAAFPGGSMTGAPKLRTMEIIESLEGGPRGVYSGALGYLSLNGSADLSIVIRTMVVAPGEVRIGTGGAITALSDPDAEIEETRVKAEPLLRVLATALRSGSAPQGGSPLPVRAAR